MERKDREGKKINMAEYHLNINGTDYYMSYNAKKEVRVETRGREARAVVLPGQFNLDMQAGRNAAVKEALASFRKAEGLLAELAQNMKGVKIPRTTCLIAGGRK